MGLQDTASRIEFVMEVWQFFFTLKSLLGIAVTSGLLTSMGMVYFRPYSVDLKHIQALLLRWVCVVKAEYCI